MYNSRIDQILNDKKLLRQMRKAIKEWDLIGNMYKAGFVFSNTVPNVDRGQYDCWIRKRKTWIEPIDKQIT
jgi:hypothetical protein